MKYGVYAIRDKHVGFMEPRCNINDQVAIRGFANAINNSPVGSDLGFAPGDFDFYKLGVFDADTGMFECGIPEFLVSGSSVVGVKSYEKET